MTCVHRAVVEASVRRQFDVHQYVAGHLVVHPKLDGHAVLPEAHFQGGIDGLHRFPAQVGVAWLGGEDDGVAAVGDPLGLVVVQRETAETVDVGVSSSPPACSELQEADRLRIEGRFIADDPAGCRGREETKAVVLAKSRRSIHTCSGLEEVPVFQVVVDPRKGGSKAIRAVLVDVRIGHGGHGVVQAVVQPKQAVTQGGHGVCGAIRVAEVEAKAVAFELLGFCTHQNGKRRRVRVDRAERGVRTHVVVAGVVLAPVAVGEAVGAVKRGILVGIVLELAVVVAAVHDNVQTLVGGDNDLSCGNLTTLRFAPLHEVLVGHGVEPAVQFVVALCGHEAAVGIKGGIHHVRRHVGKGGGHGRANAS